jgi:nephrocystin-3
MAEPRLRIFVCSTFHDMQEEREELVKKVYPQIRQLGLDRGVWVTLIDLRWGITAEQAEAGRVIPICLHEVERCRPYFVCVLGERYGWVPERIAPEVLAQYPWLAARPGMSLMEMEVRHGVLNEPSSATALCYFREPPPAPGKRDPRMTALKDELRAAGTRIAEYATAKELSARLRADLEALIDEEFPGAPLARKKDLITWQEFLGQPDKPQGTPQRTLEQVLLLEKTFARGLLPVFTPRPIAERRLDEFAAGPGKTLAIVGEEGGGKSTLLAHWFEAYRSSHADATAILRHVGRPLSALKHLLRHAAWELNERYGVGRKIDLVGPGAPALLEVLREVTGRAPTVIGIDALDQIKDGEPAELDELVVGLPPNAKVIFSTRPGSWAEGLRTLDVPVLELAGMTPREQRDMAVQYLGLYGKSLDESELARLLSRPETANPLRLRTVLEELRIFGRFELLGTAIERYAGAATDEDLYTAVLDRLEQDFQGRQREAFAWLLRYLLCARQESVREEALPELLELPELEWAELSHALSGLLVPRQYSLAFRDEALRRTAEQRYLSEAGLRRQAHMRLARYFSTRGRSRHDNEVAWHLFHAEEREALRALLTRMDPPGTFDDQDLAMYWKALRPDYDPAKEYLAMAEALPRDEPAFHLLRIGKWLRAAKEDVAAETVFRRCIAMAAGGEGLDSLTTTAALDNLAFLLGDYGRYAEALEAAQQARALADGPYRRLVVGAFQARAGQLAAAQDTLASASRVAAEQGARDVRKVAEQWLAKVRQALDKGE